MGKNYTVEEEFEEEAPAAPSSAVVAPALAGLRMDLALAKLFPQYSRNRLQAWLKAGHVLVDGRQPQGSAMTIGGEKVVVAAPPAADVAAPKAQRMERNGYVSASVSILWCASTVPFATRWSRPPSTRGVH